MRVALFGGSFDPPHRGHVALARLARRRLALDLVLVAPVGTQPLKQETRPASFGDRVAMTQLAFAGEAETEISLIDTPCSDGKHSQAANYTIDTLNTLRQRLDPADALFCIIGADSLLTIGQWHRATDLLTTCDFIAGARPGFHLANTAAALPPGISATPRTTRLPHTRLFELTARDGRRSRLYLLTDLDEDISASRIRSALHDGGDTRALLNPAVTDYILSHRLYAHL